MIGGSPIACGYYAGGLLDHGSPAPAIDGLVLRLAGRLRIGLVSDGSISISARLSARDTLDLELHDLSGALTVDPGEAVELYYLGELIFAGTVESVSEEFPVPDAASTFKSVAISCVDYNQLADRRIVTEAYAEAPAEDIVEDLVSLYLAADGISTAGIEASGIEIGPILISYRRLSEALDQIAKLIGYDWNIEYSKEFRFFSRATHYAPWGISESSRPYTSLSVRRGRADYRNVQYVRGAKDVGAARTREFLGDTKTTTWDVELPIGEEPSVYVNDSPKTVGIRGIDAEDDAAGYEFFWAKGEAAVSQNTAKTKLSGSDTLKVTFKPLIPIIIITSDYPAIAERQAVEGGSGLYEASVEDGQIEDAGLAYDYSLSFLRRYAQINDEVIVRTTSFGLRPGHIQPISIPAEGIDDEFLIVSVSARERRGSWSIEYHGLNNESAGGWPEFFKRLAKSGADFSLAAERDILKVYQASESFSIGDSETCATGDSLAPIVDDDYTTAQIPTAEIGARYEEEGATYNRGSRIGEFTHLS